MADANTWQALSIKFDALRKEELSGDPGNRRDRWLRAYSTDSIKQWQLSGGINENFRARFELLATRAGAALGSVAGSTKLNRWLYRLYAELEGSHSKLLFAPSGQSSKRNKVGKMLRQEDKGGIILRVNEASALFCTRLAREAIEKSVGTADGGVVALSTRSPLLRRYRSELKRAVLIQLSHNPDATDLEVCRALDADGGTELLKSWRRKPEDRLFEEVYRDPHRRNRIESVISKIRADLSKKGLL